MASITKNLEMAEHNVGEMMKQIRSFEALGGFIATQQIKTARILLQKGYPADYDVDEILAAYGTEDAEQVPEFDSIK